MTVRSASIQLLLILSACSFTACSTDGSRPEVTAAVGSSELSNPESQCGPTWDLQQVEQYDGTLGVSTAFVAKHERRVGYLAGTGCTGTLISDDLFISAGHCSYAVGNTIQFNYQNDPSGNARTPRDYTVSAVVEQEYNGTWDYAIVRLNGKPGIEFGHALIAPVDPPVGSHVTIIQHPGGQPKQVHAGAVVDYASSVGTNWFRHEVDTIGGSSGSGVLDDAGRLVAVHTNAGCSTGNPTQGNSAIRMSQLVSHSGTLQALAGSKILWSHTSGSVSLWSVNPDGSMRTNPAYGPYDGWSPVNVENNHILWRHTDGTISLWTVNNDGDLVTYTQNGPYDGWTAINYANNRILWRHTSGQISYWLVDDVGNLQSYVAHGPYAGWTAVGQANNRILWRHDSGAISVWVVDDNGNYLSSTLDGPYDGWTAVSYYNAEIFWTHTSGQTSVWSVNASGNLLSYGANGPYDGWTPIANADGHLLWNYADGSISYWNTGSNGEYLSHVGHGPFGGWTAISIAGGRP